MIAKSKLAAALLAAACVSCAPTHVRTGGETMSTDAAPPAAPSTAPAPTPAAATPAADRKLFALILRPGSAWKPGRPFAEQGLRPHFDYWMGLFRAGRIATAGPLGSDGGLVLLLAPSLEQAEAMMRADPAIEARIFTGEVRSYAPPMVDSGALAIKD